jgi:hypothetical protein
MDTGDQVESLLRQISNLLGKHGEPAWAEAFDALADQYEESPESTKASARTLYGGMGSFNDIVLYGPGGHPLRDENEELDRFRSRLYAACRG